MVITSSSGIVAASTFTSIGSSLAFPSASSVALPWYVPGCAWRGIQMSTQKA